MANEKIAFSNLLKRKAKLILPASSGPEPLSRLAAASFMRNVESLGFLFSQDLFESLSRLAVADLVDLQEAAVPVLKEMVGAHVPHRPLYPNFPQQVMSLTDFELYSNAVQHYFTFGEWSPEYPVDLRLPLSGSVPQARLIGTGSMDDYYAIFAGMLSAKGSLSEQDRADLNAFLLSATEDELASVLPAVIPSKETLALAAGIILRCHPEAAGLIAPQLKTATDVLRLAASLSGGDISLAQKTIFRSLSRAERRFMLGCLERSGRSLEEDMARYREMWIRLGERLHPGEYARRFPLAFAAFQKLRSGEKILTFGGKLAKELAAGQISTALSMLKTRGGELARRLDFLLRSYPDAAFEILEAFREVAPSVSTQVLLQVHAHFMARSEPRETRAFFPKGNLGRMQSVPNTLPVLPDDLCLAVCQACESGISARLAEKPALGSVYIDPRLRKVAVPLAQRSASAALRAFPRGSRFELSPSARLVRAFIHWKNVPGEGATDIDLSAVLLDGDFNFLEQISYTNLRSSRGDALVHSGDVRSAPKGASEFIDIPLTALHARGARYVAFNVYSFSQTPFCKVPQCFFGWMEREDAETGEIFDPKTVLHRSDLTADSKIAVPVIFDLYAREFIWVDLSMKANPSWHISVEGNHRSVLAVVRAMVEMARPNLHDLFRLNALARGRLVNSPGEADLVVGLDDQADVGPHHTEKILSEFL